VAEMMRLAGRLQGVAAGPGARRLRQDVLAAQVRRRKGGCFWLGGRKSPRLLRVYDKDQESEGKIPSTRVELQSRDEFATALVGRLLDARWAKRPVAEVWAEHVAQFVDLREPTGDRSASHRWPRLRRWRVLVGDVREYRSWPPTTAPWGRSSAMQRQCGGFAGVGGLAGGGYRRGRP
jgi:hypothetical protein